MQPDDIPPCLQSMVNGLIILLKQRTLTIYL